MNIAFRRRKEAGVPPGSLIYTGTTDARETKITVTDYDRDSVSVYSPETAQACVPFLQSPRVSWINVDGLHDTVLLREIGSVFDIHPLVLEDVLNTQQRPRVQVFDDQIYIVLKILHVADDAAAEPLAEIQEEQISILLGRNYVITFQERSGDPFDPIRTRLHAGAGRIRRMGADYLAYTLLDTIVDSFFSLMERFGEHLITLESSVIESPDREQLQAVYTAKRSLIALRRHIWPMREMVNALVRGDASTTETPEIVSDTTVLYLRDVYDHVIQIIDILESYRDMVAALVDLYMSSQSNRMNEVMKVLTIIATIFIPLTFIAGIYGMNFDPDTSPFNMPELQWYWGYPASLAIMAAIAGGMLLFFRKKKWI